jgi:CRISPR system Cascade subunit CasD
MEILLLRLDAPLMSFGAPIVDNHGVIQAYPAQSMITGMIANALGYDHSEFDRLQRLQERIRYASRADKPGERIRDFQTVSLGADYMSDKLAWTTDHELEERKGGKASKGTHIRYRHYWADAIHTVALTLEPDDEAPRLSDVSSALEAPERPLFIGRKACPPAGRLVLEVIEAPDLRGALERAPLHEKADSKGTYKGWWPSEPGADDPSSTTQHRPVTDQRDWANQIHVGERWIAHGMIEVEQEEAE